MKPSSTTKIPHTEYATIYDQAIAGTPFATIAATYGVTKQRISQIVHTVDPDFTRTRPSTEPPSVPCTATCAVCGVPICPPRLRYCSDVHAEAAKVLRRIIDDSHRQAVATWTLRNSSDPTQRRWARRFLAGKTESRRWIQADSEAFLLLEVAGLLDKLPKGVSIRQGRSTPSDLARRQRKLKARVPPPPPPAPPEPRKRKMTAAQRRAWARQPATKAEWGLR